VIDRGWERYHRGGQVTPAHSVLRNHLLPAGQATNSNSARHTNIGPRERNEQ